MCDSGRFRDKQSSLDEIGFDPLGPCKVVLNSSRFCSTAAASEVGAGKVKFRDC